MDLDNKGIDVNKSELIDAIAASADITKADAGRALDATVEAITNALKSGDQVTLVGFGTFQVKDRAAAYWTQPAYRR
jgi:DNA-binding protein HU-beta